MANSTNIFNKILSQFNKGLRSSFLHITILIGLNIYAYIDWKSYIRALEKRLNGE